ncbi:glycosyltransferase [Glaciecola sp. SC05]|uniref:glycosyltransferase n=1 Tax=Glaciecola sp. SC05 TaxID=1987355 RepID=UPI003528EE83
MYNLHIITNFSQVGGAEKMLARVINASCNQEHLVLSLLSVSDSVKSLLPPNVNVVSLDSKSVLGLILSIVRLVPYLNGAKKVFCWMYHAHAIGTLSYLISRSTSPLIWNVRHSLDNIKSESFSTKVAIKLGKLLGRIPNKVIYCSKRAQEQHLHYGYSPFSSAVYIPNGYIFEDFVPKNFAVSKLVIGAAGRFHVAKDFATFFEVAGRLQRIYPNVFVEVAGRNVDYDNPAVSAWIDEFHVVRSRLVLHGELSQMSDFYKRIHFFALTSITEGFPNVLAEASSFGCICISTDVGDASVIVKDSNRVVPIKGTSEMVGSFTKLFSMTSLQLNELSEDAAKDMRSRFDIKLISKQIMEVGDE